MASQPSRLPVGSSASWLSAELRAAGPAQPRACVPSQACPLPQDVGLLSTRCFPPGRAAGPWAPVHPSSAASPLICIGTEVPGTEKTPLAEG